MKDFIVVDTNSLVLYLIGKIDSNLIGEYRSRDNIVSIYTKEDFDNLAGFIEPNYTNLLVLPNILTEVDNLLNEHFNKGRHDKYISYFRELTKTARELYLSSKEGAESDVFFDLGLTDCLVLQAARECKLLITGDSNLSNFALANNIDVIDLVFIRNEKIKNP